MKTFLKYDFYLQAAVLVLYILGFLFIQPLEIRQDKYFMSFYFKIGGIQLLSFLIRLMLNYPKNWLYKIYGIFILPVWLVLLLFPTGRIPDFCLMILILSLYYSPVGVLAYIYHTYQIHSKYIQNEK